MQKRIMLIAFILGVLALFIAGAYYVAIYLPQKQKMSMDIVKLELAAKIEQEKTEQLKLEQKKENDDANKKLELLAEEQKQSDLKEKEAAEKSQRNIALRNTCLANAKTSYQKMVENTENCCNSNFDGLNPTAIVAKVRSTTETKNAGYKQASENYKELKDDCYHKYPLPNEDF